MRTVGAWRFVKVMKRPFKTLFCEQKSMPSVLDQLSKLSALNTCVVSSDEIECSLDRLRKAMADGETATVSPLKANQIVHEASFLTEEFSPVQFSAVTDFSIIGVGIIRLSRQNVPVVLLFSDLFNALVAFGLAADVAAIELESCVESSAREAKRLLGKLSQPQSQSKPHVSVRGYEPFARLESVKTAEEYSAVRDLLHSVSKRFYFEIEAEGSKAAEILRKKVGVNLCAMFFESDASAQKKAVTELSDDAVSIQAYPICSLLAAIILTNCHSHETSEDGTPLSTHSTFSVVSSDGLDLLAQVQSKEREDYRGMVDGFYFDSITTKSEAVTMASVTASLGIETYCLFEIWGSDQGEFDIEAVAENLFCCTPNAMSERLKICAQADVVSQIHGLRTALKDDEAIVTAFRDSEGSIHEVMVSTRSGLDTKDGCFFRICLERAVFLPNVVLLVVEEDKLFQFERDMAQMFTRKDTAALFAQQLLGKEASAANDKEAIFSALERISQEVNRVSSKVSSIEGKVDKIDESVAPPEGDDLSVGFKHVIEQLSALERRVKAKRA